MPNTSMDWWVIAGVIVAIVGVAIAWTAIRRKPKTGKPSVVQEMTDSHGGAQFAGRDDIHQKMKGSTGGVQDGK